MWRTVLAVVLIILIIVLAALVWLSRRTKPKYGGHEKPKTHRLTLAGRTFLRMTEEAHMPPTANDFDAPEKELWETLVAAGFIGENKLTALGRDMRKYLDGSDASRSPQLHRLAMKYSFIEKMPSVKAQRINALEPSSAAKPNWAEWDRNFPNLHKLRTHGTSELAKDGIVLVIVPQKAVLLHGKAYHPEDDMWAIATARNPDLQTRPHIVTQLELDPNGSEIINTKLALHYVLDRRARHYAIAVLERDFGTAFKWGKDGLTLELRTG